MPSDGEKIISWFPQMRDELKPETVENSAVMGATALGFLYANPILGFAFYTRYGFTRPQLKAALIVLAAIGKVDEMPT